jgi:deoxycytidylate deaminase
LNGKVIGFSQHAERCALYISSKLGYKGILDLWVVRFDNNGVLANSYPCNDCIKHLRGEKIRNVYYSSDDGTIKKEKLRDMEEKHTTKAASKWKQISHSKK